MVPKVLASSNLGLKLANAFGVFFNTEPVPFVTWNTWWISESVLALI